ncbi:MAG: hypothetical protein ACR2HJ_03115 [Fimbriimonadales bacterium]
MDSPVFAVLALIALVGLGCLCLSLLLMFFMWVLAPLRPWYDKGLAAMKAKLPKIPRFGEFRAVEGRDPMVVHLDVRDKGCSAPITGPH